MNLNCLLIIAALAGLTGCAGSKEKISAHYTAVTPSKDMMRDCLLTPPPNPKIYSTSPAAKKEELLYSFSLAQMDAMVLCNKQWDSLRTWVSEQQRIYLTK